MKAYLILGVVIIIAIIGLCVYACIRVNYDKEISYDGKDKANERE